MVKNPKRESFLKNRITSNNLLLLYELNCQHNFGLFFALRRNCATNVVRNRIKRVFRQKFKDNILQVLNEKNINKFSFCLIVRRGIKFEEDKCRVGSSLYRELEYLVNKTVSKFR